MHTKTSLLTSAIAIDHRCHDAYFALALALHPDEEIHVVHEYLTKRDLLIRSLSIKPMAACYTELGHLVAKGRCLSLNGDICLSKQELFKHAIQLDPTDVTSYHSLAASMLDKERTMLYGTNTCITKETLLRKALRIDSKYSLLYTELAETVPPGGNIPWEGEKCVDADWLNKKAISLDFRCAVGYLALARNNIDLPTTDSIQLENGSSYGVVGLLNQALCFDANLHEAYYLLARHGFVFRGVHTTPDDTQVCVNAIPFTKVQLLSKAIQLSPTPKPEYLTLLGDHLEDSAVPLEIEEKTFTKETLYIAAIAADHRFAKAHHRLGCLLPYDGSAALGHTVLNKEQLLKRAILLDNSQSDYYLDLALSMRVGAKTILEDACEEVNREDLMDTAINLAPDSVRAMMHKALESAQPKEILLKVVSLAPDWPEGIYQLAMCLGPSDTISVFGTTHTRISLLFLLIEQKDGGDAFPLVYYALGIYATENTVEIGGTQYTAATLFKKCLKIDPKCSDAYFNLAELNLEIQIHGETLGRTSLYQKSVVYDRYNVAKRLRLAQQLAVEETVVLPEGEVTAVDILTHAADLDAYNTEVKYCLAMYLPAGGVVAFRGGGRASREALFASHLGHHRDACTLNNAAVVHLRHAKIPGASQRTQRTLLEEAVQHFEANPAVYSIDGSELYYNLAEVTLESAEARKLYLKAIMLAPRKHLFYYFALSGVLTGSDDVLPAALFPDNALVCPQDGGFSEVSLLCAVLAEDPQFYPAYRSLALAIYRKPHTFPNGVEVNGVHYSVCALLEKGFNERHISNAPLITEGMQALATFEHDMSSVFERGLAVYSQNPVAYLNMSFFGVRTLADNRVVRREVLLRHAESLAERDGENELRGFICFCLAGSAGVPATRRALLLEAVRLYPCAAVYTMLGDGVAEGGTLVLPSSRRMSRKEVFCTAAQQTASASEGRDAAWAKLLNEMCPGEVLEVGGVTVRKDLMTVRTAKMR